MDKSWFSHVFYGFSHEDFEFRPSLLRYRTTHQAGDLWRNWYGTNFKTWYGDRQPEVWPCVDHLPRLAVLFVDACSFCGFHLGHQQLQSNNRVTSNILPSTTVSRCF